MTALKAYDPAGEVDKREFRSVPGQPGQLVLISTTRARRAPPVHAVPTHPPSHVDNCPFCVGNEARTPREISRLDADGTWALRVIENLFPAVAPSGAAAESQSVTRFPASGFHEVIVDHPDHGMTLARMSLAHITSILCVYRERGAKLLAQNPRLRCVLAFKNAGRAAGGSIDHSHSQVMALEVVPPALQVAVAVMEEHRQRTGTCLQCDSINGALASAEDTPATLVDQSQRFIVFKPVAGRSEWELHITPINHEESYFSADPDALGELADLLRTTMRRLLAVIGPFDYNLCVVSAPRPNQGQFHWRIEIHPRTSTPMAVEMGWGLPLHSVCPVQAAMRLRNIDLSTESH